MKTGRPTVFDQYNLKILDLIKAYEEYGSIEKAAQSLGISGKTFQKYMKGVPKRNYAKRPRKKPKKYLEQQWISSLVAKKKTVLDIRGRRIPVALIKRLEVVSLEKGVKALMKGELRDGNETFFLFRYPNQKEENPESPDREMDSNPHE